MPSTPKSTYNEALTTGTNPWVKRSEANSTLLVQFSSKLFQESEPDADSYYDTLYSGVRPGFVRLADFWEIPHWIGFASYSVPNSDVYIVRNLDEATRFFSQAGYERLVFSVLDVNKDLVRLVATKYDGKLDIGGYVSPHLFFDLPNVQWHDSINSLTDSLGVPYRQGVDYSHFAGSECIPRLTLSQGCYHKCSFCTVPKVLDISPKEFIDQQVDAIKALKAKLVYVNDKTFGQASNYQYLAELPLEGYIVQTTPAQLLKIPEDWLKNSRIRYVELGIESYNDPILRSMHKPATEAMIDRACEVLRRTGVRLIPNIIIGYLGETRETYARTLRFMRRNADIISHANIYNLAIYEGTELGEQVEVLTPDDQNENVLEKSFHTDPEIHREFASEIYSLALDLVLGRHEQICRGLPV